MTDTQINILITVLTAGLAGIAAAIRFSVGRAVKSIDVNSAAMLENTKSNAILGTKIDSIANYVQRRSKVSSEVKEFIQQEISGVHNVAVVGPEDITPVEVPPHDKRTATAQGGAYSKVKRAKSEPGGTR